MERAPIDVGGKLPIYNDIEKVKNAQSLRELKDALEPILKYLAYIAITSEGMVMEEKREWDDVTDQQLRRETGIPQKTTRPMGSQHISSIMSTLRTRQEFDKWIADD